MNLVAKSRARLRFRSCGHVLPPRWSLLHFVDSGATWHGLPPCNLPDQVIIAKSLETSKYYSTMPCNRDKLHLPQGFSWTSVEPSLWWRAIVQALCQDYPRSFRGGSNLGWVKLYSFEALQLNTSFRILETMFNGPTIHNLTDRWNTDEKLTSIARVLPCCSSDREPPPREMSKLETKRASPGVPRPLLMLYPTITRPWIISWTYPVLISACNLVGLSHGTLRFLPYIAHDAIYRLFFTAIGC